jgi:hypothetical protein
MTKTAKQKDVQQNRDDDLPLCTSEPLNKISDSELLTYIEAWERGKARFETGLKTIKNELLTRKEAEIQALLKAKTEPFGDVNIIVGNHKVKVNVPKKVTWDAALLAKKHAEIVASGENPAMYMKVEYDVSETAYKAFPAEVRDYFMDARTVTSGNPTVKIVEDKE